MQCIHISEVEGKTAVCFDTALDPRSFARTKMGQCFTEPGYIVHPDGTILPWKATAVNDINGFMRVWGSPFAGERLDIILDKAVFSESADQSAATQPAAAQPLQAAAVQTPLQAALQAVVYWIRAKLLLGETSSTLNPGAVFVCKKDGEHPKGTVFFTPENLSQRCLFAEGTEINRYSCPDLTDTDAAAFCAGVMLYSILAKTHPYPDDEVIFQDMREGVFLPPRLAIPGLDEKLCELIQSALTLPVVIKGPHESGTAILGNLLKILSDKEKGTAAVSSLFHQSSEEEEDLLIKEKKRFLFKQNFSVKSQRFVTRNKAALIGTAVAFAFVVFMAGSMVRARFDRPTTAGMASDTVVMAYYDAFGMLNHLFMEACVFGDVDKSDINMATNFFVISRVRQSTEMASRPSIISARVWQENGGELPSPNVFGVTDLTVKQIGGNEHEGLIAYRADYLLWFPNEDAPSSRSDELTLTLRRGAWRITNINRTINN